MGVHLERWHAGMLEALHAARLAPIPARARPRCLTDVGPRRTQHRNLRGAKEESFGSSNTHPCNCNVAAGSVGFEG